MSSADVATNQNQVSDKKSDINQNKQQNQAGSGSDDQKQINGKNVIATKVTGIVKWFNVKSGYGFIHREDVDEDIFVHQTAIIKNNPQKYLRSVGDDETVEFDIVQGEKGLEAANVTGPNGDDVKGSKYAADKKEYNTRGGDRPIFRGRGGPMMFRGRGEFSRGGGRPMYRGRGGPSFHGQGEFFHGGRRPMFRGRGGPSFRGQGEFFRGGGRPLFRGRGFFHPGGFDQGFDQGFDNYGPPPMFGRPPHGFGGPMLRGHGRPPFRGNYGLDGDFEGRGRPPFRGNYGFDGDFEDRGPRMFRGRGGPMMEGQMGQPFGFRGRDRGRGRYFRGARQGNRSDSNNDNNNDNQIEGQGHG